MLIGPHGRSLLNAKKLSTVSQKIEDSYEDCFSKITSTSAQQNVVYMLLENKHVKIEGLVAYTCLYV